MTSGDELITQYAARLVYEKGDIGIGTIYTRMKIGEYIILDPYLEVVLCTPFHFLLLLFLIS